MRNYLGSGSDYRFKHKIVVKNLGKSRKIERQNLELLWNEAGKIKNKRSKTKVQVGSGSGSVGSGSGSVGSGSGSTYDELAKCFLHVLIRFII